MSNTILDNTSLFTLVYKWRKKIILVSFVAAIIAAVVYSIILFVVIEKTWPREGDDE